MMFSINYPLRNLLFKTETATFTYSYNEKASPIVTKGVNDSFKDEDLESEQEQLIKCDLKERIITYYRNEILVIPVTEIAFIYIDNTITYVVSMNGQKSTTNCSLDHLITQLDHHHFFRINRQIILGICCIEKIVRLGQGLKILTQPSLEKRIIVGKNKALRFKNWLNS